MIRGEDLTVAYYADIHVLQDVTVEAAEGLITCVIGPNGAGKSTLVKTLFGYLSPNKGSVYLEDSDITALAGQERMRLGIGYVDQMHSVFPEMSVDENLELGAWTFRRDSARVAEAKEAVYVQYPGLDKQRETAAGSLSGGQQRMLDMARILMPDPSVLLIDEPSAGLAPKIAKEVYSDIIRLKDQGKTILLVDQNLNQAVRISDYLYVMEFGRVSNHGPSVDLGDDLREIVSSWLAVT
ncbi:MAG: ATP-binding cassette domain-containing protein [Acidimicrobiia bacterium]|nr:ATP-binding cassette domain-containing protein [Acidimicrobiia bacterium]